MFKILFVTFPLFILIGCSQTTESDATSDVDKTNVSEHIALTDYESFYGLFEKVELPHTMNQHSIYECKNGHFCLEQHKDRILDGKVISAKQLDYLTSLTPLNKEHQQFADWCKLNLEQLDDEWNQAVPGIKFNNNGNTVMTLYTFSQENENKTGFWEIWLIQMNENNELTYFNKLGLMGNTCFLDAGEEKGAKYSILNTDYEYFTAEFDGQQCNITLQRWSTKKGYDWRVDQNLKVNDSTSRDDVFLTYKY